MRTLRTVAMLTTLLAGLCVALLPHTQAQIIATPLPDLTITNVVENGNTVTLTCRNIGAANAGGFYVRAFEWKNNAWYGAGLKWVPSLAKSGTLNVQITAPGIGAQINKYVIDSHGYIQESNENNNLVYFPPPAG